MDEKTKIRYHTVDGLRGIAAMLVAIYHLTPPALEATNNWLATAMKAVAQFGYLGVPIFFVLSGFVITMTIKRDTGSFGYIGQFALKRSIRLDPPYWLSIAVDCALIYVAGSLLHASTTELPTPAAIGAHLLYAQDLLGIRPIAAIYWTLCLEVQFYLCLCLIVVLGNRVARQFGISTVGIIAPSLVGVTVASIAIGAGAINNPIQGLFLSHWYLFALGGACRWATEGNRGAIFAGYVLAVTALFCWQAVDNLPYALNTLAAVVTAVILFAAIRLGKISTWLASRPLLYLGGISYSLYLFHASIGERFIAGMNQFVLPRLGIDAAALPVALVVLLAALVVCVIASTIVYRLVEAPAMRLSKRITNTRKQSNAIEVPA